MDPPASTTPAVRLTMVSSAEPHSGGSSPTPHHNGQVATYDAVSAASRDLMYDQLCNMIAQEERDGYKCCDYLSHYSPNQPSEKSKGSKSIDEGCRTSICGWMYRLTDHFGIDREVVSIALSYIDRILSTNYCADRRTFKLISATALHLAIKVHYPHMWQEVGSLLPELSRGDFLLDDIVVMEKELTHSLSWLVNPATPQSISMQILSLLPPDAPRTTLNHVAGMALFFSELSVCDYSFVTSRKSMVAIAAVLNAFESVCFTSYGSPNGPFHNVERLLSNIGYHFDWHEISSARERLWGLYRQSSDEPPVQEEDPATPLSSPRKTIHDESPSPTSCVDHRMHGFSNNAC